MEIPKKSFQKGLGEVRVCQLAACRQEIMRVLGVTTLQSLRNYAAGLKKLDVVTAVEIEKVFLKYGVKKPWGDVPLQN